MKMLKNLIIFRVFLNEEEIKSENIPSKESNDFDIDKILDITNELKIEEDEFKKMLDSQVDEEINKEKFEIKEDEEEKNYKSIQNNLFNCFWDELQKGFDTETEKKKKTFLDSIKEEFFPFDKIFDDKVNSFNKNLDKIIIEANKAKDEAKKINNFIPLISLIKPEEKGENLDQVVKGKQKEIQIDQKEEKNIIIEKPEKNDNNIIKVDNPEKPKVGKKDLSIKKKVELNKDEVNKIFQYFEDKTYVSATVGEDKMKDIIIKFGGNTEKLNYYVENYDPDKDEEEIMKEYVPIEPEIEQNELPIEKEEELSNDKINEIYKNLEETYNVSKIIGEEKMKEEIKKHGGDMGKLKEFVVSKIVADKKDKDNIKVNEQEKPDDDKKILPNKKDGELSEDKVNEIYEDIESRYYVSGIIGEEETKAIIRMLEGNMKKIEEKVESILGA